LNQSGWKKSKACEPASTLKKKSAQGRAEAAQAGWSARARMAARVSQILQRP
jgi:hypothetical protein